MIYDAFADVFDEYAANYDYDAWYRYLRSLSRLNSMQDSSICELGCGTGLLLVEFAKDGAQTVGIDNSPQMLTIAERRFQEAGFDAKLLCADMSSFVWPEPFDFMYSAGDCLNYLDGSQITSLFANMRSLLKPGAVFTFDMLNEALFFTKEEGERVRETEHDGLKLTRELFDSQMKTRIYINGKLAEEHHQYFYGTAQVIELCKKSGLRMDGVFTILRRTPPSEHSQKLQFVIQRP